MVLEELNIPVEKLNHDPYLTSYKISSKSIIKKNVKVKSISLLEENSRGHLCELMIGKYFLDHQREQTIKNDKFDKIFIKIKIFCCPKYTLKNEKLRHWLGENIHNTYIL